MKVIDKPKKVYYPKVDDLIIIKEIIPSTSLSVSGTDTIAEDITLLNVVARVTDIKEKSIPTIYKSGPSITVEYQTRACNGDHMTVRRKLSITNDGSIHNGVCTYYYPLDLEVEFKRPNERIAITEFGVECEGTFDEKNNEIINKN